MKVLILPAIAFVVTACAGNPAAIRQAEQSCRVQAGASADAECVARATERIYKSWGRDSISRGA